MERQRNVFQLKEQIKTPEKELTTVEASNLPDAEFKTVVIRMLKELGEDLNNIKKDMGTIQNNQSEMKSTLEGINSTLDEARIRSVI